MIARRIHQFFRAGFGTYRMLPCAVVRSIDPSLTRASLTLAIAVALVGCQTARPDARQGVILVVVDTARADHFGADGYARNTTPHMDRLAAEGAWFSNAWAQAPWTLPTITTILTGQPPGVHGAGMQNETFYPLRDEIPTLAERLSEASMRTGAVVNVIFCNPSSGLDRGFESYDFRTSDPTNLGHRNAAATTDAALEWVEQVAEAPFFLLVHYFDTHLTYDPPPPFDTKFLDEGVPAIAPGFGNVTDIQALRDGTIPITDAMQTGLIARYDGELGFLDQEFGRLRAGLEAIGRWDDSLIVVVGDHGEEFWDHGGFEHGHSHHRELLRVPLILRYPDSAANGVRIDRVRQIDIVPTVLNYLGIAIPDDLPGTDLTQRHANSATANGSLWAGDLVSVRTDDGTLILDRSTGARFVYGPDDPLELHDLRDSDPLRLRRLMEQLPVEGQLHGDADKTWSPSDDELQRLRSLGYIQ